MKPPTVNRSKVVTLPANVVSDPIPTLGSNKLHIICTQNFDISFSDNGTATFPDPIVATIPYPLREVHIFDLGPKNTHFKILSTASMAFRYWPIGPPISNPLTLDMISAPATLALSCYRKLRRPYAGFAFRVRRSDNAEQNIGFLEDLVDTAALLAFVGAGGSAWIVTLYDQSGNGRNIVQATPAMQPRIVNAGVLESYASGKPAIFFPGGGVELRNTTAPTGILPSGSPNITVGDTHQWTANSWLCAFGANGALSHSVFLISGGGLTPIQKSHYNSGSSYTTLLDANTAPRYYVVQHTAGEDTGSGKVRQNGVDLVRASSTPATFAFSDGNLEIGNTPAFANSNFLGRLNAFIMFNAVLAGTDLSLLEAELASHV